VRLLLDYCCPVWAPVYKTDINLIERVQRCFTKRLLGLKDISYHDRLVILDNADTLEIRRLKMDLIMLFKITLNFVALDFCSFFGLTNCTSTRGRNYKLVKPIYVITMPASFRLLVDELMHGTIYPLTL